MQTEVKKRALFDLSAITLFNLLMQLMIDTGYGDDDGNITPLGEQYLAAIDPENTPDTLIFDLPVNLASVPSSEADRGDANHPHHFLEADDFPDDDPDEESKFAQEHWADEMEADDVS